jgi:hypothetical protein
MLPCETPKSSSTSLASPRARGKYRLHCRSVPGFAIDFHVSAGLLDEPIDLAQPQTRPVTDLLGGEKRLECAGKNIRRHAVASVADTDERILAGRDFGIRAAIIPIERLIGGFHCQLAAIRHGVSGVDRDVDEACFELGNVDLDGPEPRRADDLEFDRLSE